MTSVNQIYECINGFAPFDTAEDWDNVGLLVGCGDTIVTKALLSLDITAQVVEQAHEEGAQLIISHHPVIFGGLKRVLSDSPVYLAAKYGISCICAHTNLDRSPVFGVNTCLAKAIGLENCTPSDKAELLFLADVPNEPTPKRLADIIKKNLDMSAVPFTDFGKPLKKAALCSGAGGSEIYAAASEGCDVFITGEMKHHELIFANANGISVFILGHFKSEDVVITPLAERLSGEFDDVEFVKSSFTDGIII